MFENSKFNRTKIGSIILILTIIFSLIFIVSGIVDIVEENNDYDEGRSLTIYENQEFSQYVDYSETYTLKFTPSESGYYYLDLSGASIKSVTSSSGASVSYNTASSYDYKIYFSSSSTTYTITIYTNKSYIEGKILRESSSSNSSSPSGNFTIYKDQSFGYSTSRYETYTLTFTTGYSGYYYLDLSGATIKSVTSSSGASVSYDTASSYDYKIYFSSSYTTYTITIYTNSTYISGEITY